MPLINQFVNVDDITYEQIIAHINDKKLDKECYLCGCNMWQLAGVAPSGQNLIQHIELPLPTSQIVVNNNNPAAKYTEYYSYQCFSLTCFNCYHIRLFAKSGIKEGWDKRLVAAIEASEVKDEPK